MESIKSDDKTKNSNSITSNNLEDEINTKLKVNDVPQNSITKSEDKNENTIDIDANIKEVRLAVIGNVDSGKSTLVGCLTKNVKDDGRGYARQFVFNYQHETETGRTSSIAEEILGFKDNKPLDIGRANEKKNTSWKEVVEKSDHIITLLDLCGHEKYLKTTMYGLTALLPDYAIILIGTNMGVQRMTKEHLGIVVSLNIPFFIVFTKIDIAPKDIKENTVNTFSTLLKNGLQKTVYHVKSNEDAKACSQAIIGNAVVPVFQVSTVTGEGIDYLKFFLANLAPRHSLNSENSIIKTPEDKVEMLLDSSFNTKVGVIFAGVLTSGKISVGMKLLMGPLNDGSFKLVQIKNIQFLRGDVNEISCGNSCSLKLKSLDKNYELSTENFRKGMVLVSPESHLTPSIEFEIEALIVHHSSTIKVGYQSVVHCNVVRQTAAIVEMNKDCMRAGDTGIIKFRFMKSPEYLHLGDIVLFREGRTRGKGKIIKLTPFDEKKGTIEKMDPKNVRKNNNITNKSNTNNTISSNNANASTGKKKNDNKKKK